MMQKIVKTILLTCALTLLCGCQNDARIGWIFGVWGLESYTLDGAPQESQLIKTTTFAFQANVIRIDNIEDQYLTANEYYGTWVKQDDDRVITFNFGHHDDTHPAGTGIYEAPQWLGMTSAEKMTMTISDQSSSRMTLTWLRPDGLTAIYKLKKTW